MLSLLQCFKLLITHSVGGKATQPTEEEGSAVKLPRNQPTQNNCYTETESKTWEQVLLTGLLIGCGEEF